MWCIVCLMLNFETHLFYMGTIYLLTPLSSLPLRPLHFTPCYHPTPCLPSHPPPLNAHPPRHSPLTLFTFICPVPSSSHFHPHIKHRADCPLQRNPLPVHLHWCIISVVDQGPVSDCRAAEPFLSCLCQMPGRVAGWNPSTKPTTASLSWLQGSSMEMLRKTKVSGKISTHCGSVVNTHIVFSLCWVLSCVSLKYGCVFSVICGVCRGSLERDLKWCLLGIYLRFSCVL